MNLGVLIDILLCGAISIMIALGFNAWLDRRPPRE